MAQFQFRKFDYLPPVIKSLIIVNVIVWIIQISFGRNFPLDNLFALHDIRSEYFRPHQLITHMFMHDPSSFFHLLLNMLALWMFGSSLENVWGQKRFLTFYLICGLGAAALHLTVLWFQNSHTLEMARQGLISPALLEQYGLDAAEYVQIKLNEATLGASGAVFGCLAAFGYLFPNTYIYVYALFPVKAKWFVLFYAAVELYSGVSATAGDNVAHFAHLGGALAGFLLVYYWNKKNRQHFY